MLVSRFCAFERAATLAEMRYAVRITGYQNLAHLQPKEAHYREATSAFNFANRVDPGNLTNPNNLINVLGQGIYYTATGANDAAQKNFDVVLGRQPRNVLALLGKACILLRKRSYLAALKLYQDVLRLSLTANEIEADLGRWKGPDPRVGIGLCLWGLGRQEDARRAWKRAAEVSPKSAAPHLLLGLSAINAFKNPGPLPPGYFGADITTDEAGARSAAYKQGIASIQEAWKRDNRNAAAAVALAEHFVDRAQHAQALKLSEHAIQYADSRSALTQAYLYFARAAHLAAQAGGAPELRPLALRFYAKAADDLGRTFGPTPTAAPGLPAAQNAGAGLALAGLGTAQLQLSARDVLAAMNTLDGLLSKQPNCIEGALMAASLRAKSHPGASKEELAADRERARSLLDRALKSVDAASAELAASATAVASVSGLSRLTLAAIVALGADPTVHIEMATLLQDTDLERATGAYTEALRLTLEKEAQQQGENVAADPAITELAVNLLTNLGGVTALRGMEKSVSAGGDAGSEERLALLDAGRARLGEALTRAADAGLDAPMATATYNLGRVYEAIGRADSAREAYERLLGGHPEYTDAKVRLALLAVSNGRREKDVANTLFKEALASNPGALDTRAAYAHFLAGQTTGAPNPQWSAVKDLAAQLLGPNPPGFPSATAARLAADEARRDPHTLSTLGWAYYQLALLPSTTSSNPRAERARQMFRAADLLDKALAADPRCAFAAQGLTVLLSEDALVTSSAEAHQSGAEERRKKNWDEAIALLGKLREVREDGSVHVCAGHVLMMKEEFERALKSVSAVTACWIDQLAGTVRLHP